jgi:FkbM family methyltransferase
MFEPDLVSMGAEFSHESCIDLDIGANFGLWGLSLISNEHYKGLGVHFFEPNPHCHRYIQRSLCELYSLDVQFAFNAAVGSDNGEVYLSIKEAELGQSQIALLDEGVKARVITIDSFLSELGSQSIGIVKVDVEGFELEVLKGMEETLAKNPPRAFIIECNNEHLQRYGANSQELMARMRQAGYSLFLFRAKDCENNLFAECSRFALKRCDSPLLISLDNLPGYGTDFLAIRNDICEIMLCQVHV